MGSSTLVMAVIDEHDNIIRTLNLGDSGYMLLRKMKDDDN
jgi:hypothetical protein